MKHGEFLNFLEKSFPQACNSRGRLVVKELSKIVEMHHSTFYDANKTGKVSRKTAKLIVLAANGTITEADIAKFVM